MSGSALKSVEIAPPEGGMKDLFQRGNHNAISKEMMITGINFRQVKCYRNEKCTLRISRLIAELADTIAIINNWASVILVFTFSVKAV
jgi:hypothetical protein